MSQAAPRLGRGLAALMGDQHDANGARNAPLSGARDISIEHLQPGPFQPRISFHADSLRELTDSIRAHGILQPLLARPHPAKAGQFQIIAGERRWRAAQTAGLHEVPVLVRDLSNADAMAASLVENLQRTDLDPIEEAEGFRRLTEEFGLTQEQLGAAVGKSRSHVANVMRLLNLPQAVRTLLQEGRLSPGHARALLSHPDPEAAANTIIARGLNVRQAEALSTSKPGKLKARDDMPDPEAQALERDLSERLGLQVKLTFDGQSGAVNIRFSNLDQLDGLVALLSPT